MKLPQRMSLRLGFWAVLLLGIFAWAPATYPGYWQAVEGFGPVFNLLSPGRLATMAMVPDLWRGTGRAAFLLTRPLLLLGIDGVSAVRVSFVLCFILGGLGIYIWLRDRIGDRPAGLAGLLYMLAPSFLATVYVRGSLGDALIAALFPIALAGVAIFAETGVISAAGIVLVALGWMWQTQTGLSLFCSAILLLYALLVERSRMAVLVVLLSSASAMALMIPLWGMQAPTAVQFTDHFVAFFQLFSAQWEVAPSVPGWQDHYPFQLGIALLLFSLLALWLWSFKRPFHTPDVINRLFWFSAIGAVFCLFLTTAGSGTLWQWSGADRLLTYPWQLLLLAAPLLTVTASYLLVAQPQFQQAPYWPVLLLLIVVSTYPSLTPEFTHYQPPVEPVAVFGTNELVLLTATLTEDRVQRIATLAVAWQPISVLKADYNFFFQALQGDEQTVTVAAQLDAQPLGAERPATLWRPGEILTNTYQLDLSTIAPTVQLQYHFGYYDWSNGVRLPVDGGIDDKVIFYGD